MDRDLAPMDIEYGGTATIEQGIMLYEYLPLDRNLREIRLFTLKGSENFQDPIDGTLAIVSLDDDPAYDALSYVWGQTSHHKPVRISGRTLGVTENLDVALRYLRRPKSPRVLWIDAICLNQSDTMERSFQVAQMRYIFENASEVQIWLGPSGAYTDLALKSLEDILAFDGSFDKIREYGGVPGHNDDLDAGFADLFGRDWWNRMWVVQELVLSTRATFHCGYYSMAWPSAVTSRMSLVHLQFFFEKSKLVVQQASAYFLRTVMELLRTQARRADLVQAPLFELVDLFRRRECIDHRDRVFALLSLTTDTDADSNPPDYSLSVQEVERRLMESTISQTQRLDILSFSVGLDRSHPLYSPCPSWLAAWRLVPQSRVATLGFTSSVAYVPLFRSYCAAGKSAAHTRFSSTGTEPQLLTFQGFILDELDFLCSKEPPSARRSYRDTKFSRQLEAWASELPAYRILKQYANERTERQQIHSTYGDYVGLRDAFWRTLMADTDPDAALRREMRSPEPCFHISDRQQNVIRLFEDWSIEPFIKRQRYYGGVLDACKCRQYFESKRGRLGLAPLLSQKGDFICILLGGKTPFVIRLAGEGQYQLVGECYVHGVMDGEAMRGLEVGEYKLEDITLC